MNKPTYILSKILKNRLKNTKKPILIVKSMKSINKDIIKYNSTDYLYNSFYIFYKNR